MSSGTTVIIELLGGVALLLWGVRMVRTGVMRAWGDRLKRFIEARLSNRLTAFAAGASATTILGSGTAMSLIVAGLAAGGAVTTSLGLAVLLGADLGSAAVSGAFVSGSSYLVFVAPLLLFGGYCVFSASREFRPHNVGRILIGLGLMLLALRLITAATAPLRDASLFHAVLTAIGNEPVLAFITGAVLAWLCHSTLAVILLAASLLANGSLELAGAISLILGVNCGGGLPAVTATSIQPPAARRVPVANLLCRALLAIGLLGFVEQAMPLLSSLALAPVHAAIGFHVAFNLAAGLFFLPLTGVMARLATKLVPDDKEAPDHLTEPRYLDRLALATPALALSNAVLETVRMSELLDRMFTAALLTLRNGSLEDLKQLKLMDSRLNAYQRSVQAYLSDLAQTDLKDDDARRAVEIMLYASNLEHAGDIVQLNLADRLKAKTKESIALSEEQQTAIDELCRTIHQSLRLATGVLATGDIEAARRLVAQKDSFRLMENRILGEHFRRTAGAKPSSLRASALFVDLVRDLHRINSHVVAAAYPVVEHAGLLRDTRLRPEEPIPLREVSSG
jgi:phosphate:Na+ symporter